MSTNSTAADALAALLDKDPLESDLQDLLEQKSELVPVVDILNHDVQWNSVLSKFRLPRGKVADLAYITKSTANWRVVLIELEQSSKQLFVTTGHPDFHSDTRKAIAQVNDWKLDEADAIRGALAPLMQVGGHFDTNPVEVVYTLVIGRNQRGDFSREEVNLVFRLQQEQRVRLLTWDSVLRVAQEETRWRLNVLSFANNRPTFKYAQAETNLFAHFSDKQLTVSEPHEKWFAAQGFDMTSWRAGSLLVLNNKHPAGNVQAALHAAGFGQTRPKA